MIRRGFAVILVLLVCMVSVTAWAGKPGGGDFGDATIQCNISWQGTCP